MKTITLILSEGKKLAFEFIEEMGHILMEGQKNRVFYVKASAYELIMSYEKLWRRRMCRLHGKIGGI